ncbi:hypothetical protein ACM64Y_19435 [Novispirillum sp. DQ9]|uniref:hypothetical protein n=1 Tax=Novispirillum sp. DQ9 TaxID=3398612 RepID=UPI003C7E8231
MPDGADYAAFKQALLRVMAEEDRLPGPAHRTLSEVVEDHGLEIPDAEWLHHAVVDFCETGLIQLDGYSLVPNPGEPILYCITLHGLERAGGL